MKRCRAFTLVELSVVIGIIVILMTIALPVLNKARDHAKAVTCQNNLHALWQGFMCFAADHDNRMPGCWADQLVGSDPDHTDWLFGPYAPITNGGGGGYDTVMMAPQSGTIFKYVNHNFNVYRCPALDLADNGNNIGPGGASNGRFDYTAFEFFSGTHVSRLPQQARIVAQDGTILMQLPCPTITEEEAGSANGAWKDSDHAQGDQMGHQHWGGGYYVATDGSVQYFVEPLNYNAYMYWVPTIRNPSPGVRIGDTGYGAQTWGWFEAQ